MYLTQSLFALLIRLLELFEWALILSAIVSTLISFGVLDSRNRIVWTVGDFLYRITEPALRPIRRVVPAFSGIDISPLIALLLIQYVVIPLVVQIEMAIVAPATFG